MTAAAKKIEPTAAPAKARPRRQSNGTEKVSMSLGKAELRWLAKEAKREGTTLSMKVTEAIRIYRRNQARDRVLAYLGDAAIVTDEDRKRIEAEWA